MSEIELPELPEKEMSESKMNTIIAITVTLLVTFMAFCKIHDNNLVLEMQKIQAERVDTWGRYNSLHVREDLNNSKIMDLNADLQAEETASHTALIHTKLQAYTAIDAKLKEKKESVKKEAEGYEATYQKLEAVHEKFDYSEAAISIAVSLLALTTLLKKHPMYFVAIIPGIFGVVKGVMGLMG